MDIFKETVNQADRQTQIPGREGDIEANNSNTSVSLLALAHREFAVFG